MLGDQSSGLLSPGAVMLADLNGDGIPDLIVANSGSNNVLVYPGLGNGQFGPAVNDGHGFFTGTDPIGLYVADLTGNGIPDLVVANAGSNDVSVLLGRARARTGRWSPARESRPMPGRSPWPSGDFFGTGQLDLAVANQASQQRRGVSQCRQRIFQRHRADDLRRRPGASGLFLGNFTGSGTSIATLNSGSNTISLIGQSGVIQTIAAGGLRPSPDSRAISRERFHRPRRRRQRRWTVRALHRRPERPEPEPDDHERRRSEPDIAELRRHLRRRAQLLRQHGGGRVGDASRVQPRGRGIRERG